MARRIPQSPGGSGARRGSFGEMDAPSTGGGFPNLSPMGSSYNQNPGYPAGLNMAGYPGTSVNQYYTEYGGGSAGFNSPEPSGGNFGSGMGMSNTAPSGLPMPPFDGSTGPPPMHRRDSYGTPGVDRRSSIPGVGYGGAPQSQGYSPSSVSYSNLPPFTSPSGNPNYGRSALPSTQSIGNSSAINSGVMLPPVSPTQSIPPMQLGLKPQRTTRTYRKKTPPDACAVCSTGQTPEWRKGPSGLRTLCNACGLTAAKQIPQREAETIEEVWQQLTDIGMNRFRGEFTLSEERKNAAYVSWRAARGSGQVARIGNRHSTYSQSNVSPGNYRERAGSTTAPRNPGDLEGAQALFSMSRGRGMSFSEARSSTSAHPYGQLQSTYSTTSPNPPTLPTVDNVYERRGTIGGLNAAGRMAISGLLNDEPPPSRPLSAGSSRSPTSGRAGYNNFPR